MSVETDRWQALASCSVVAFSAYCFRKSLVLPESLGHSYTRSKAGYLAHSIGFAYGLAERLSTGLRRCRRHRDSRPQVSSFLLGSG